jgi:hypothetical protein
VLFGVLVVAVGGLVWLGRPGLAELRAWLSQQRWMVLGAEAVFAVSFGLMAVVRANNPEILGTEKPMEFMFINSILRSPAFPAHDAWLSGHAISYYYFGYVIIAALARVTATTSSVAFNLGLSLLFALVAAGAHGVVLNLMALEKHRARSLTAAFWPALLGPVLVLVVGNFYGLAQLAYTNGAFADSNIWAVRYYFGAQDPANSPEVQKNAADPAITEPGIRAGPVNFWAWLDLKQAELPAPAAPPALTWNVGGQWFYGARVIHDRNLDGPEVEAIDEMPAFSFLLGDMHPHVLSLPFSVLAIGLALEWLLWGASEWALRREKREMGSDSPEAGDLDCRRSSFVFRHSFFPHCPRPRRPVLPQHLGFSDLPVPDHCGFCVGAGAALGLEGAGAGLVAHRGVGGRAGLAERCPLFSVLPDVSIPGGRHSAKRDLAHALPADHCFLWPAADWRQHLPRLAGQARPAHPGPAGRLDRGWRPCVGAGGRGDPHADRSVVQRVVEIRRGAIPQPADIWGGLRPGNPTPHCR